MTKAKQLLYIDTGPSEVHIEALLNRRGIAVRMTQAVAPAQLREALTRPDCWDLILCGQESFIELDVEDRLAKVRRNLDASLILLTSDRTTPPLWWYRRGAADVASRTDMDHLLTICERELEHCASRRELRQLRHMAGVLEGGSRPPLMLATIHDLGTHPQVPTAEPTISEKGDHPVPPEVRIKSLIEASGLVLEYQPIISFRTRDEHRGMFEALVRLKDEGGRNLLPEEFLPVVERCGWMGKVDLWILRRALATLSEIQASGSSEAVLFVNIATSTLRSSEHVSALGALATAAKISPGSLVVEVRKMAFEEAPEGVRQLSELLRAKHHGLLVEDIGPEDRGLIVEHGERLTHLKLDRRLVKGLFERRVPQQGLHDLVSCARDQGLRVIALAVENAELLSTLFAAGVDAIQGHFVSLPYPNLVYPSVQRVESSSSPQWSVTRR